MNINKLLQLNLDGIREDERTHHPRYSGLSGSVGIGNEKGSVGLAGSISKEGYDFLQNISGRLNINDKVSLSARGNKARGRGMYQNQASALAEAIYKYGTANKHSDIAFNRRHKGYDNSLDNKSTGAWYEKKF